MREAFVGCKHCGFVAATGGYVGSARGCPECGNELREMGTIDALNLVGKDSGRKSSLPRHPFEDRKGDSSRPRVER